MFDEDPLQEAAAVDATLRMLRYRGWRVIDAVLVFVFGVQAVVVDLGEMKLGRLVGTFVLEETPEGTS